MTDAQDLSKAPPAPAPATADVPLALSPEGSPDPPSVPSPPPAVDPSAQQSDRVGPRPVLRSDTLARMSTTGWLLCGGAAAVIIASLLPWVSVSSDGIGIPISSSPRGGAPVVFIVLAAAALAFGSPAIRGELPKRRMLGLTLVVAVLSIFVITNWSDLSDLQKANSDLQISGGSGLYLYTVGVVAMWACVIRIWLASRRATTAVS
jgi:hypothetical protein